METNMRKSRTLLTIIFALIAACAPKANNSAASLEGASDGIKPLEQKVDRQPFCGVEQYNAKEDPSCGIASYNLARSAACGVADYYERADMSCPGSVTEDVQREVAGSDDCYSSGGTPAGCPAGYADLGISNTHRTCHVGGHEGQSTDVVVQKTRTCKRPQVAATCRSPAFGIEAYNPCRDESHGVEHYVTCNDPKFGVARYNKCAFYLTAEEAAIWVNDHGNELELHSNGLITSRGNFFAYKADELGLACTIKGFESDPLYSDKVKDLETLFLSSFGINYQSSAYTCPAPAGSTNIDAYSCPDSDTSTVCRNWRMYKAHKLWLSVTRDDATKLLSDVGTAQDANVKSRVADLAGALDKLLKADAQTNNSH